MRGHFLKPRFVFDLLSVFDNLDDAAAAIDGGLHLYNAEVLVAVIAESIGRDWRQKSTAQ